MLSFEQGSGCCSTLTRSSMLGTRLSVEACERISHIFYVLALFAWNLDFISSSPLFLAATCPCALGRISSFFYVKSGLGSPCSSHLEIWTYFYEQYLAVSACVSLRCFWKNFTYFQRVGCPGSLRSSHLKIWTLFLLAVIWRWEGFLGGSDAFFALLRVVPELSASFWSPRWRRVLCHRGLPLPIRLW